MKVLVAIFSAADTWTIPARHVDALRRRFPGVTFAHAEDDETMRREAADADVAFSSLVRGDVLAGAPRLAWIHSSAAGVGSLLSPELKRGGVVLTNSRGVHADFIAEHVVAVTLALFRKLHLAVRRQLEGRWAQAELNAAPPPRLLRGATAGVVGLGAIGAAVARAMTGLGADVRAIRRRPGLAPPPGVSRAGGPDELPDLLAGADVVVLAAPLTGETRGLIGRHELALMKAGAVLVNVSRGKLVREDELADALTRGVIAGAALDVFEHEPLDPGSPLWRLPNTLITPHTSGFRPDYWDVVTDLFAENLQRYRRGEPLVNVVDPEAGY